MDEDGELEYYCFTEAAVSEDECRDLIPGFTHFAVETCADSEKEWDYDDAESFCRHEFWAMAYYGAMCCRDGFPVCERFTRMSSQLCLDEDDFNPEAIWNRRCQKLFASPAERDAECAARHRQDWDEDGDGKDETFACVSAEVETEADCEALFPGHSDFAAETCGSRNFAWAFRDGDEALGHCHERFWTTASGGDDVGWFVARCCGGGPSECERHASPLCLHPQHYTPAREFFACHLELPPPPASSPSSPSSSSSSVACPEGLLRYEHRSAATGRLEAWCQGGDFASCDACVAAAGPAALCTRDEACGMRAPEWAWGSTRLAGGRGGDDDDDDEPGFEDDSEEDDDGAGKCEHEAEAMAYHAAKCCSDGLSVCERFNQELR